MAMEHEIIREEVIFLICVEGQDEEKLVGRFLRSKGADENTYQIISVGGSQKFHKKMPPLVKQQNFQNITTLVIVRDAEESFTQTVESIRGTLRENSLPEPDTHGIFTQRSSDTELSVGFFIMPGGQRDGMLEDLCLDWFKHDYPLAWNCLESYCNCIDAAISSKHILPIPNIHKAKALMMLATSPDNATHLGLAAEQDFFDFNSPVWQELADFFTAAGLIP